MKTIFDVHIKKGNGELVDLSSKKGSIFLVVNTASKCGFAPQYKQLEALHQKYCNQGLVILAFPCDQFAHQEPYSYTEIVSICERNYGVTFPIMEKVLVNGEHSHPLFSFLKESSSGFLHSAIKWNFTKFLVGKDGTTVIRFAPTVSPESLEPTIEKLLAQPFDQ